MKVRSQMSEVPHYPLGTSDQIVRVSERFAAAYTALTEDAVIGTISYRILKYRKKIYKEPLEATNNSIQGVLLQNLSSVPVHQVVIFTSFDIHSKLASNEGSSMNISDEIERLQLLYEQGALSESEFREAKARVLKGESSSAFSIGTVDAETVFGMNVHSWCLLMHISQLLHFAAGAGFVIPLVMWIMSKDNNAEADRQGVAILNWLITLAIALAVSGALSFVLIGIPFLVIYGLLSIIFPIIGAIKAANGEFWEYPTSIRFIRYAAENANEQHSTYF